MGRRRRHETRSPRRESVSRFVRWGLPAAVALVTLACFAPALHNDFVNWDDPLNLTENPHFRGLSATHLRWMFTTFHMGHYQPLSWITLAVDYRFWGLDPTGYHLTNIVLHTGNAVLFYLISLRLLCLAVGRAAAPATATSAVRTAAAASALFFALHPLRAESVVWVTERRDVLSAFFYLATVLGYLRMQASPRASRSRHWWLVFSIFCLLLSSLSKAWGMTLPVVLLAIDVYPLRRLTAGERPLPLVLEKLPYALPAAGVAVLALIAQSHGAEMLAVEQYGLAARLAQAAYGLCFYLVKTVLPLRLSPAYALDPNLDPTAPVHVGAVATVVLVTALALVTWKRWPWLLVSWLCYVAIVSPVLGLVQTGPQLVADRYTYLSCLPWALLAGAAAYQVLMRAWPGMIACLAGLGVLAVLTIHQTRLWRDSMTLWNHALRLDPGNAVAHVNRGAAYESSGNLERAAADYAAAIQRNPAYADAYFGRGNVRRVQGDLDGAFADYDVVVQLRPHDPIGYANRGGIRHQKGDLEGAATDYRRALEIGSSDWVFRSIVVDNLAQIDHPVESKDP
jgi:hypothetical protein